ncbi:hypothetical protein WOLCODRAFT_109015 [Wolfiporia cocos MD-104 SS10]|uniref:Uncharacterized protein n=1 Tax=Wolfiporia cocos (strain MD-104) TaxID=742152 RepID=A0A2H3J3X5_WOLCO|nr:hypothetical protein WOLCODRAFT_109015 [Wolfiporia cocos MD-104 SS10]
MRGASASLTQAQGEKRQFEETLLGLQGKLKQTSANLERAGDDRRLLEGRIAELQKAWEDDLQHQEQANKEHARALAVLRKKHQDTLTLLETRTSELRAAQTYLSMVDSLSEADLLRMLGELNSLVYQLTAQMADCKMDFTEMKANVEQHIGPHLLDLVVARAHSAEPICVQVALQSAIVRFATSVIATWNFQHDAANDMFRKVYDRLRDTEEPSVSTRWRVLTQSSLRSITWSEATEHHLRNNLAELVTEIMLLAGSSISPPALYQTLCTQFGERLQSIITISLSLQKAMGEGVVSSHLEPSICTWGMPFNPNEMVDAFPSSHERTPRPSDRSSPLLLGTTEVGLQRVEQRESGDKIAGHPHIVMLLKPKVVLETFIDELRANGI